MTTMIGIDPHKGSHTAVAIDRDEHTLDEVRVRSGATQADRLRQWAAPFEDRVWAVESAQGLGYLLAQQLVAAGETVLDVPPMRRPGAGARLGPSQKNDPNDARSIAIAEGKTTKEAIRALKRRLSDVIYRHLVADARRFEEQ